MSEVEKKSAGNSGIAELRREYGHREALHRKSLDDSPIEQFRKWFTEARSAGIVEPNAAVLSTANGDGEVTSRMVLLKAYDERGFVFFTNYGSRKAQDIAVNTHCSFLFPWVNLERQVIICGRASRISHAESLAYFLSRPLGSRLGAWVSDQSRVISSGALMKKKFSEMVEKFRAGDIPLPDFWGGYRIVPHRIEFWQGGENRLHDRFLYTRKSNDLWSIERLQP